MKIAKEGQIIEWSFSKDDKWEVVSGKTFQSEVRMVDREQKHYGVYAPYGQDLIPFDRATIVK